MKLDKYMLFSKYNEFLDSKKKLEDLMSKAKHDTDVVLSDLKSILAYIDMHCSLTDNDLSFIYESILKIISFIEDSK